MTGKSTQELIGLGHAEIEETNKTLGDIEMLVEQTQLIGTQVSGGGAVG
jgi:hypothetical protein